MKTIIQTTTRKRTVAILALFLAIGIAVGMVGCQGEQAKKEPLTLTELYKTELKGTGGKELTAFLVEVAPGAAIPKHYHPGYEFAYVLEGAGSIEWEQGKPKFDVKPGASINDYSDPPPAKPGFVHWGTNSSKTKPQKWLVVLVAEKGQQLLIPVK